MKKLLVVLTLVLIASIGLTGISLAAGDNPLKCDTRYPIILAHGMADSPTILGTVDYWWGIPEALRDEGAGVYCTSVSSIGSTSSKALDFSRQVTDFIAASGAEKVNIIAHGHGALYARYAISNEGLAPKVASFTSIAGPNQGSSIASLIVSLDNNISMIMSALGDSAIMNALGDLLGVDIAGALDFLGDPVKYVTDFLYPLIFGGTDVNGLDNALDLCPDYMINTFNPNTPDMAGVYYQSWAAKAKTGCPSIILNPTWLFMLTKEGANDGLVSVESAKWGNFRGVEDAAWWSPGCDHLNIIGHLFGVTPGFNAPQFYVGIVEDLKARGY